MRFDPRPDPDGGRGLPSSPGERLVRRTGSGLAVFTLAMIAILLAAVGLVTALAVVQMTDLSVDQNLHAAAENMLTALEPTPTPTPTAEPSVTPGPTDEETETTSPQETSNDEKPRRTGEGEGESNGEPGGRPVPTPAVAPVLELAPAPTPPPTPTPTLAPQPTTPTATPAATGGATDEKPPGSSDTFFLVIDTAGNVIDNPQAVQLSDLPDLDAVAVAVAGGEDWRTVTADGVQVRLLTEPMHNLDGSIFGVLQSGFKLTAYDDQKALIVRTIIFTSLIGLLGAALVTLVVTRRAMSPIRAAFDAERRFVASASHELRTPVAVVRASAEILQREDLVKPEGHKLVDDVVAESDRLGRLVGDLLALASAEAGQISVTLSVFDVRELADEVAGRVHGIAVERDVSVEMVQEGSTGPGDAELLVHADRERMLQLLMIFIDNAIDHSPPNGVVRIVVRPEGETAKRRVAVDVLDQGPGVPVADRDRIFEPFAKVGGRRRTTGTTGLGLAIARILAERQNATLSVRDAPGGGACFSVSLARRLPRESPATA